VKNGKNWWKIGPGYWKIGHNCCKNWPKLLENSRNCKLLQIVAKIDQIVANTGQSCWKKLVKIVEKLVKIVGKNGQNCRKIGENWSFPQPATGKTSKAFGAMQDDGNFILFDGLGGLYFSTNTCCRSGSYLIVQGSILRSSISAETFPDNFTSTNFGQKTAFKNSSEHYGRKSRISRYCKTMRDNNYKLELDQISFYIHICKFRPQQFH
jgi:hypothetical protein